MNDVNVEGSVVVVVRQLQLDVAPNVRRFVVLNRRQHVISTSQHDVIVTTYGVWIGAKRRKFDDLTADV